MVTTATRAAYRPRVQLTLVSRTDDLLVMEQAYDAADVPPPPHLHPSQAEHFVVLAGQVSATVGGVPHVYATGEAFDVPAGTVHTMGPHGGAARIRWEVRPALRTWEFLSGMPESLEDRIAHVMRYAEEFRLG
jgi:hypothetical protein